MQFLNLGVVDSIARSLGETMEVDFDEGTISRVQFVRVRINWNVDHPLRFQRNYQFTPGVNTVLSFFYQRLRGFCEICGLLTHDSGRCLIQNGGVGPNDSDTGSDEDGGAPAPHGNHGVQIQELDDMGHSLPHDDMGDDMIVENPPAIDNEAGVEMGPLQDTQEIVQVEHRIEDTDF